MVTRPKRQCADQVGRARSRSYRSVCDRSAAKARAEATAKRIGMEWAAELGHLPGGRYQVFRIRHVDLARED